MARVAGSTHDLLQALNGATACAMRLRLTDNALALARKALATASGTPDSDPVMRRLLSNFVIVAATAGEFEEAEAVFERLAATVDARADAEISAQLPLLRLNMLIDRGDFGAASRLAPAVVEESSHGPHALRAKHSGALIPLATGDVDAALPMLEDMAGAFELQGSPHELLAFLTDLIQAQAMAGDFGRVRDLHTRAQGLIVESTCAFDGVDLARLAGLDAFGLALTGELAPIRQRLSQLNILLTTYGRQAEAERLSRRIVRFMADAAGRRSELVADEALGRYLDSPYVANLHFRQGEMAALASYVTTIGPLLAEVDRPLLEQAAASPLTARSVLLRRFADHRTARPEVAPEAKVLAVLRDYAHGMETSEYTTVVEKIRQQGGRRYDDDVVERFSKLHVA